MRTVLAIKRGTGARRHGVAAVLASAAAIAIQLAVPVAARATGATAGGPDLSFGQATAIKLPANAKSGAGAMLLSVSCTAKGDCLAGGVYLDRGFQSEPMVVTEARGKWHAAVEVRLPADAAAQPSAAAYGVACTSAGNCVAVGHYQTGSGTRGGFIATETRGRWARARQTPEPKNAGPDGAELYAVTCPSRRSCDAAGYYFDKNNDTHAMVVSEVSGRWSAVALAVPANTLSGVGGFPAGIGCSSPRDCFTGGAYYDNSSATDDYVALGVAESRGHWRRGVQVSLPGNAASHNSELNAVSCTSDGRCLAVGYYDNTSSYGSIAVTETGGRISSADEITAQPPDTYGSELNGVGCVKSALCVGAGYYASTTDPSLALLVIRSSGTWGHAGTVKLPKNGRTTTPTSYLYAVSCATDGYCAAVGYYDDSSDLSIPMATTAG